MTDRIIVVARIGNSQCYTIHHPRGIAPAIQSGGARYGGLSPFIIIYDNNLR